PRGSIVLEAVFIALGEIKDSRAVEPLIEALEENWGYNSYVAQTLVKIGQPAVEPLIKVLGDKDDNVRDTARKIVVQIGQPAVEPLVRALGDKNAVIRSSAASVLEQLNWQPRIQQEQIAYLFAKQDWEALVKIGQPAVEALIRALNDSSIQTFAQEALIKIIPQMNNFESLTKLVNLDNASIKLEALKSLAQLKDQRAIPLFIDNLSHQDKNIQKQATEGLVSIGQPSVQPLTNLYLTTQSSLKDNVLKVLKQIGQPSVDYLVTKINESLQNNDSETARKYLSLLKELNPEVYDEFEKKVKGEALEELKDKLLFFGKFILIPASILAVLAGIAIAVKNLISDYLKSRKDRLHSFAPILPLGLIGNPPTIDTNLIYIGLALAGLGILTHTILKLIKQQRASLEWKSWVMISMVVFVGLLYSVFEAGDKLSYIALLSGAGFLGTVSFRESELPDIISPLMVRFHRKMQELSK
ncbi:MAG: HEAT repeat domain-containing protein, partial [Candidatus Desantisbacteria bacterium]